LQAARQQPAPKDIGLSGGRRVAGWSSHAGTSSERGDPAVSL
jgi:hypothetical protein